MKELGKLLSIKDNGNLVGVQNITLVFEHAEINQVRSWLSTSDGVCLHDLVYSINNIAAMANAQPEFVYDLIRNLSTLQLGQDPIPANVATEAMTNGKTTVRTYDILYKHWFEVVSAIEQHTKWDGSVTNAAEHTFINGRSGVTVVLYDPELEKMALIEEFRIGLLEEDSPWAIGLVTGGIEEGEVPEVAAQRKAIEEAGLTITDLNKLCEYKLDPGFTSHTIHAFKGRVDLSDVDSVINGLEAKQEDIRLLVKPYSEVKRMLHNNEFVSGTAMVALHTFFNA